MKDVKWGVRRQKGVRSVKGGRKEWLWVILETVLNTPSNSEILFMLSATEVILVRTMGKNVV